MPKLEKRLEDRLFRIQRLVALTVGGAIVYVVVLLCLAYLLSLAGVGLNDNQGGAGWIFLFLALPAIPILALGPIAGTIYAAVTLVFVSSRQRRLFSACTFILLGFISCLELWYVFKDASGQ